MALNSEIETNKAIKPMVNYELNEGAGYDSRNDINDTTNTTVSSNKHTTKTILNIILLSLLVYCIIGITYLLFFDSHNNCQCAQSKMQSSFTSTINITTDTPTTTSTMPTNNPTITITKTYAHYIGDYKISAQNKSHNNWLLCDGSFIDPNQYDKLFNLIGYSFGSRSQIYGSVLLFALPNGNDQSIGINGNTHKSGDKIGQANMSLNIQHIPSHSHMITHSGNCKNTNGYSETQPYLSQQCGMKKNYYDAYFLATTKSLPDAIKTSNVGNDNSFELYQPTIFVGNLFIYAAHD